MASRRFFDEAQVELSLLPITSDFSLDNTNTSLFINCYVYSNINIDAEIGVNL